jgi:hypothetical protein
MVPAILIRKRHLTLLSLTDSVLIGPQPRHRKPSARMILYTPEWQNNVAVRPHSIALGGSKTLHWVQNRLYSAIGVSRSTRSTSDRSGRGWCGVL